MGFIIVFLSVETLANDKEKTRRDAAELALERNRSDRGKASAVKNRILRHRAIPAVEDQRCELQLHCRTGNRRSGIHVLGRIPKPLFWVLSKAERPADASRATEIGSDLKSFIICSFATLNCTNYTIWHAQTH
jgi:hypothetical protein